MKSRAHNGKNTILREFQNKFRNSLRRRKTTEERAANIYNGLAAIHDNGV